MRNRYKVVITKSKNVLRMVAQTVLLLALTCTLPSRSAYCFSSEDNPYVFEPGDKILVTVFGQEDLSGEYTVDDQGHVQLPVGGPVRVGGATLQESRRRLKELLLADGFLKNPQVSVRIAELRPVFIIGAVKEPGGFPFRFGMTVADVIALAGGFGIEETRRSSLPQFFAAKERLAILKRNRRDLRIRLARIDAELAGDSTMVLPEHIRMDQGPVTQSMIKEQEALLLLSASQHERSVELIRMQIPRVEAEIAALKKERAAAERRAKLARDYDKIYDDLRKKGLARANTTLDTQTAIALHEGTVARIDARLSSLAQAKGNLAIDLQRAINDRIAGIKVEKQRVLSQLNEILVSLPFVESLVAFNKNDLGISTDQGNLPYKVFLSRRTKPRNIRTEVDMYTSVFPGDVLDVRVTLRKQDLDFPAAKGLETQSMATELLH